MEYVVVNEKGNVVGKVFLAYWWPGRKYKQEESLPPEMRRAIKRADKAGSKYLGFAAADCPGIGEFSAVSRCMRIDKPSRSYGRDRAIGLLQQKIGEHKLRIKKHGGG